ncbi:MAG: DUF1799 domain-containing protein [Roseococcus sp.]
MSLAAIRPPAPTKDAPIGVFPANWAALRVFLNLATQWRHAGADGVPVGVDYLAVRVVAELLGVPADADLLARLRVLEGEALRVMREEAERERGRRPAGQA